MILPKIINSGVYNMAQKAVQTLQLPWISLYISGLIRSTNYYPDGTVCDLLDKHNAVPRLALGYPGFRTEFEYGPDRENWVTMLHFDDLTYDDREHQFYLREKGLLFPIPRTIELQPSEVVSLRTQFCTITEYFYSTIPRNQLAAEMMLMQLLLRFIQEKNNCDDQVERFRKMLDSDLHWERSIESICRELGIGRDHMRRKFFDRYKITPGDYRIRKRLQHIQYLFFYSTKNMKEIAYEVGMKNPSHLSAFIRQQCGMTPFELCRQYRSGNIVPQKKERSYGTPIPGTCG